jgi:hypothetical protein
MRRALSSAPTFGHGGAVAGQGGPRSGVGIQRIRVAESPSVSGRSTHAFLIFRSRVGYTALARSPGRVEAVGLPAAAAHPERKYGMARKKQSNRARFTRQAKAKGNTKVGRRAKSTAAPKRKRSNWLSER